MSKWTSFFLTETVESDEDEIDPFLNSVIQVNGPIDDLDLLRPRGLNDKGAAITTPKLPQTHASKQTELGPTNSAGQDIVAGKVEETRPGRRSRPVCSTRAVSRHCTA